MKKIVLTIATLVAVAASATAQNFKKGDWFLGAGTSNLMVGSLFTADDSETDLEASLNGGYFLFDKMAVETRLSFNGTWYNHEFDANYSFGAGLRYYPVGNLFGSASYLGTVAAKGFPVRSHLMTGIGYDWFVSDRVFLEPALYYSRKLIKGGYNSLFLSLAVGVKF